MVVTTSAAAGLQGSQHGSWLHALNDLQTAWCLLICRVPQTTKPLGWNANWDGSIGKHHISFEQESVGRFVGLLNGISDAKATFYVDT